MSYSSLWYKIGNIPSLSYTFLKYETYFNIAENLLERRRDNSIDMY